MISKRFRVASDGGRWPVMESYSRIQMDQRFVKNEWRNPHIIYTNKRFYSEFFTVECGVLCRFFNDRWKMGEAR